MSRRIKSKLDPRKHYLQVALNSTLEEAQKIIAQLPKSERIILEAGTPLIKRYGLRAISQLTDWYQQHLWGQSLSLPIFPDSSAWSFIQKMTPIKLEIPRPAESPETENFIRPYVVADLKTMDRGQTEVELAARAGASAAVALGNAPIETLNAFIENCESLGLDPMIDMMNVDYPLTVLRKLKKIPPVVILHRGVDEEQFNREKQIPLHEIRRIKGAYDIMISIAGGDTLREVERSIFNDADIVVIWKSVFQSTGETLELVQGFLKEIK